MARRSTRAALEADNQLRLPTGEGRTRYSSRNPQIDIRYRLNQLRRYISGVAGIAHSSGLALDVGVEVESDLGPVEGVF